ncbi:MAG: hypothetical protein V4580_09430 [Bacteroidota bacterium]
MKKIVFIFCTVLSFYGFSQTGKYSIPVSKLTEIMIEKNYSPLQREELNKYPEKLKSLDYLYSKSFEISEHKPYTAEQFEKIDMAKYFSQRKVDEYVLVFDEASGLPLVLYSFNKMEADKVLIMPASGKIAK